MSVVEGQLTQESETNHHRVFCGGPYQSYWWDDEHLPLHPSICAVLAQEVDAAALEQAWQRTLRVYPLLGCVPMAVDEEVHFFAAATPSVPLHSSRTVRPGCAEVDCKGVSVTYWGNTLVLSVYHSIADERGLLEVFKTLLSCYVAALAHAEPDAAYAMLEEGRAPEQYFVQSTMLQPTDYKPQPVVLYRDIRDIFLDDRVGEDRSDELTVSKLLISYDSYAALCEKSGLCMDELFAYALSKGIYALHPDERRDLSWALMCDFRGTFGITETIAPCSKPMPFIVSRREIVDLPLREAAAAISKRRAHQRSDDYVKTHVAMENTYGLLNIKNPSLRINFAGEIDLGVAGDCLMDVTLLDPSLRTINLVRLGDSVLVSLQYGRVTDEYASAAVHALRDLGISVEIAQKAQAIPAECSALEA